MNRTSLNIDAKRVHDKSALLNALRQLNPRAVVVMDGLGLAQEIKAAFPSCIVIHRAFGDSEAHKHRDPRETARRWHGEGYGNIYTYGINEPVAGDGKSWRDICAWLVANMDEQRRLGLRGVIGNWPPGSISEGAIAQGEFDDYLRAESQHADWHIRGEHDYTGFLLPWGGGWGGRAPEDVLVKDRVQFDRWTTREQFQSEVGASYHLGRGRWLDRRARAIGVTRQIPKVCTEFGLDRMPDWELRPTNVYAVATSRYGTSGYSIIRGLNSYRAYYEAMFPGISFEEMIYRQMQWAESVYPPEYLALCWFQWTPGTADWDRAFGFDMSKHSGIYARFETGEPPVSTIPAVPKSVDAGAGVKARMKEGYKLRAGNGTMYSEVRVVAPQTIVTYYPDTAKADADPARAARKWVWVEVENVGGWMASEDQFARLVPPGWPTGSGVTLGVPFVSQRNTGEANNCGEAALTSLLRFIGQARGDALLAALPIADVVTLVNNKGGFSSFADLINAAQVILDPVAVLDTPVEAKANLTLDALRAELDASRPLIALVERGKLPGALAYHSFGGAHFVPVVAYDGETITVLDPLKEGITDGKLRVYVNDFADAWRATTGNSGLYQALLFDPSAFEPDVEPEPPPLKSPWLTLDEFAQYTDALEKMHAAVAEMHTICKQALARASDT